MSEVNAWHVVVMRPLHQAQPLLHAISQLGYEAISLPTLTITPITPSPQSVEQWCHHLHEADVIIVSSQNAILCAPLPVLDALKSTKAKVVTIGQATTNLLKANGVSVFFTPLPGSDSEALLTNSFLQTNEIANKNVVLLAGLGGREVLAETLAKRGALIHWVKVYQQLRPSLALEPMLSSWVLFGKPFCFIATSLNSLDHFLNSVPAEHLAWLRQQAFIVVSERIAQAAIKWEIQHIFVAKGAHQEQLCATLLHVTQFCHTMT